MNVEDPPNPEWIIRLADGQYLYATQWNANKSGQDPIGGTREMAYAGFTYDRAAACAALFEGATVEELNPPPDDACQRFALLELDGKTKAAP